MVSASSAVVVNGRRYLRAPVPIHFPVEEEVPEGGVHNEVLHLLFALLRGELAGRAFVGSDQFLYWDAADPRKCVAPDIMIRLDAPDAPVPSWKVWERGAPHLAVEVMSPVNLSDRDWSSKLERYRHVGVSELVRFDPEDELAPLRLWDRIEGDLVERDLEDPEGFLSDVLGLYWQVLPDARLGRMLRLARDAAGNVLLPTPEEKAKAAAERVAELEAELAKRPPRSD